jgi:hypothetical protein
MKQQLGDIQMAFITSRGRSGSTLLQSILNAHPNISAPIESKFILHLKSKYQYTINWDEKTVKQFVDDLFTNRKIKLFWNMEKDNIINAFSVYEVNSFADACKVVYIAFPQMSPKEEIKLLVDKNPAHSRFIPDLLEVFPNAKFIHLIRDPRATIRSQMKAFQKKSIYHLAQLWFFLNKKMAQQYEESKINSTRVYYEKLVVNPKNVLKQLMEFLQLEFKEEMLESHKSTRELAKNNSYLSLPHHQNTSNPINQESLHKWKKALDAQELKIIHAICYQLGNELAYDIPEEQLNFQQRIRLFFAKRRIMVIHGMVKTLFWFPFEIRKIIFGVVSLFFDKKYKK